MLPLKSDSAARHVRLCPASTHKEMQGAPNFCLPVLGSSHIVGFSDFVVRSGRRVRPCRQQQHCDRGRRWRRRSCCRDRRSTAVARASASSPVSREGTGRARPDDGDQGNVGTSRIPFRTPEAERNPRRSQDPRGFRFFALWLGYRDLGCGITGRETCALFQTVNLEGTTRSLCRAVAQPG